MSTPHIFNAIYHTLCSFCGKRADCMSHRLSSSSPPGSVGFFESRRVRFCCLECWERLIVGKETAKAGETPPLEGSDAGQTRL